MAYFATRDASTGLVSGAGEVSAVSDPSARNLFRVEDRPQEIGRLVVDGLALAMPDRTPWRLRPLVCQGLGFVGTILTRERQRGLNLRIGRRPASRTPYDADGIAHNELASGFAKFERKGLPQGEHAGVDRRAVRARDAVEAFPRRIAEERTNPDGVFSAAAMHRRFSDGARDGLDRTKHERVVTPKRSAAYPTAAVLHRVTPSRSIENSEAQMTVGVASGGTRGSERLADHAADCACAGEEA